MRNPLLPLGAAVLLFLSVFAMPLVGQPQNGLGNGGDPRPRRSGRPAPRSADGRALLGGTAEEKGVWLPDNPFIPNPLASPRKRTFPSSPGRGRCTPVAERIRSNRTRGASHRVARECS